MEIKYIGKTLLIEDSGERVLVIGDLHLGYEEAMRTNGILVPSGIYEEIVREIELVFDYLEKKRKKVDKVVLLGDVRHEFGRILKSEWKEVLDFLDYLKEKIGKKGEIVVVKGNHDTMTVNIVKKKNIEIVDYYIWGGLAFLHGDKDFDVVYDKDIKYWVMGHAHPAVVLQDKKSVKKEKYKCFLVGKFKRKEIIVVPSFFPIVEGSDVTGLNGNELGLAWDFKLGSFEVKIVEGEESLETLDFGRLNKF
ncbi:hypothetical protein COU60_01235 [Candidatus Pacearchaeota archaeon CG10_big_fil_rev_8_21_14_0_10_34_76]|nr:MAG: hypothetical protein COU60_01235 [Candidatus Pacearchaeota archaeon CG10_big_fil_rev_8_21_14_0_10_34_76]